MSPNSAVVAQREPVLDAAVRDGRPVIGPTRLPSGEVIAVCEDAQRAAFALR